MSCGGFEEYIKLKLISNDPSSSGEVNINVGVWTKMEKIKKIYSSCKGLPIENIRLQFNGRRINGDITPWNLDMKDSDIIEVFMDKPFELLSEDNIFIKCIGLSGDRTFKIKQSTNFGRIMRYYSECLNMPEKDINFCYNAKSIISTDTPWSLNIKPDDKIKVYSKYIDEKSENSITQSQHILIKLKGQDFNIFGDGGKYFKIKMKTHFARLFKYYNYRYGLQESSIRFLFNEIKISPKDTPEGLAMKNDDVIEVFLVDKDDAESYENSIENDYIKIKAFDYDNVLRRFKVRRKTKFRKLKKSYSRSVGVPVIHLRFLYMNITIEDDDTPETLKMFENVVIEVVQERSAPKATF